MSSFLTDPSEPGAELWEADSESGCPVCIPFSWVTSYTAQSLTNAEILRLLRHIHFPEVVGSDIRGTKDTPPMDVEVRPLAINWSDKLHDDQDKIWNAVSTDLQEPQAHTCLWYHLLNGPGQTTVNDVDTMPLTDGPPLFLHALCFLMRAYVLGIQEVHFVIDSRWMGPARSGHGLRTELRKLWLKLFFPGCKVSAEDIVNMYTQDEGLATFAEG